MNHIRERSSAGSHAAPVGPVEEAVVRAHAARDAGHPREVRVAAVGGDDEAPAQRAARALAILDHDAATPSPSPSSSVAVQPGSSSTPGVSAVMRRRSGSRTWRVTL